MIVQRFMEEDKNNTRKHEEQTQKHKGALEMARAIVGRPSNHKPSQPTSADTTPYRFVTYPEFMPSRSGSVGSTVTLRRLLLISYISAGAVASAFFVLRVCFLFSFWLTSQLFLQPLLRRLVKARREFYQHVFEKLGLLADKISSTF
jgi:hypothetical protein